MKTAVEWLIQQLENHNGVTRAGFENVIQNAKQMEKEQMLDIYINHNQYNDNFLGFDDFYKETFKLE